MRVLDDHIERQAHEYQGGNGRECFICHGPYYITPGLEDICGVCLDCAQEAVRDALRYRYLRAGHQGCYNRVMIHALTALDDAVDEAIDARTANPVPSQVTLSDATDDEVRAESKRRFPPPPNPRAKV